MCVSVSVSVPMCACNTTVKSFVCVGVSMYACLCRIIICMERRHTHSTHTRKKKQSLTPNSNAQYVLPKRKQHNTHVKGVSWILCSSRLNPVTPFLPSVPTGVVTCFPMSHEVHAKEPILAGIAQLVSAPGADAREMRRPSCFFLSGFW